MVDAQPDGGMVLFADIEKRNQTLAYVVEFGPILLVGIVVVCECLGPVGEVARVDAYLFYVAGSDFGCLRIEMNIGDKRCRVAFRPQSGADVCQVSGFAPSLCRKAYIVGSRIDDRDTLGDAVVGVEGRRIGHRLYPDGIVASHRGVAYLYDRTFAAVIIVYIHEDACLGLRLRGRPGRLADVPDGLIRATAYQLVL